VILEFGIGIAAAIIASFFACRVLIHTGPIDHPHELHKAHVAPTPSSGGVGIGIGFAVGMATLAFLSGQWRDDTMFQGGAMPWAVAAFAYPLLLIGYVDDARHLGARLKFVLFSALSVGASLSLGVVAELPLGQGVVVPLGFVFGLVGTALWVFTLVNCVNFMDGANGLAMGSVAVGLFGLAAVAAAQGSPNGVAICLCGGGALIGFLFWNFPRGHLFAGDSGALFSGAIAALVSLGLIHETGLSPFVPPILFFPLLADALLTLAWRVSRGRPLLVGHTEHLYQVAMRVGWSHARVTFAYWCAMAACGVIGLSVARMPNSVAPGLALAALALMSIALSFLVRRYTVRHGIADV
jgi:UDP-N-acetylmuramyl pentapeptide phosphotransferase/UDP-N-acetylglucosamine-1-phosphate transferase